MSMCRMRNRDFVVRWRIVRMASALAALVCVAGCGHDGGGGNNRPSTTLEEHRQFRAIAGISMGAYGAINIATKHPELFGSIGALGGPVDMQQLLRDSIEDDFEVKAQTGIPRNVGDDFTFDHLPSYPDRDSRISEGEDLVIAFGNPFLHHPDPARQYLASDSEPAHLLVDDQFGPFVLPSNPRGFLDGGDTNKDGVRQTGETPTQPTDVILLAGGSLARIAPGAQGVTLGERTLADLDGDGVFDVGDGIVLNYSEPFTDTNGNFVFEPELGETFTDVGLDGVAGSGDFGEGNGQFDYDPDRARWLAEDPLTRLASRSTADIMTQRIYMDVGTRDEFGFERHYTNLVAVLESKGITVLQDHDFQGNCVAVPNTSAPYLLIRYAGGHVGFPEVDANDLFSGDICGSTIIWQRLRSVIGFMNESFPDGFFGPGSDFGLPSIPKPLAGDALDLNPTGDLVTGELPSPALQASGKPVPMRSIVVYRPPAFFHSDHDFPIVYFLGGYGQAPKDYEHMRELLDSFILSGQIQNMYFAFLPGNGGRKGSFYVNHAVPETQVPEVPEVTSGRYEDSIIQDLIPTIENQILDGRIKR